MVGVEAEQVSAATVYFPTGRDLAAWRDKYERGESPDAVPYGLNRLEDHFAEVVTRSFPADSMVRKGMRRVMRGGSARWWRGRGPVGLTWDENTAVRLAFVRGLSKRYAGVIWLTDAIQRNGPARYHGVRRLLRRMDGLWVLSAAQLDPLRQFVGTDGPPVHHVLFGIDADFFAPQPLPSEPLVVSVGGDRDRDAETLFDALSLLRVERPDVEIIVQSTSTSSPPPGVQVVPYLTHAELRALYARASLALIATRPNMHVSGMTVGLEAMATGRPLVITRSPGMDDYFGDTDGAFMVEAGDSHAMAQGVIRLLDPATLEHAGLAARTHVEQRFTTAHLAERLASVVHGSSDSN